MSMYLWQPLCETELNLVGYIEDQLIRDVNKVKRKLWAQTYLHDNFDDDIWSDETTVQLENHRRLCYRKDGEKPQLKPRPKHPIKS